MYGRATYIGVIWGHKWGKCNMQTTLYVDILGLFFGSAEQLRSELRTESQFPKLRRLHAAEQVTGEGLGLPGGGAHGFRSAREMT